MTAPAPLSPAALALVTLIAEGLDNRAIAARLNLAFATVKHRVDALIRRHRTCSRTGLVGLACRAGQLGPAALVPPVVPLRLREVLPGLAAGWSNPRIGRSLHLSLDAVKSRAAELYRLLGANGRANAVLLAYRAGLLPEVAR